jgi:hypothetical protein
MSGFGFPTHHRHQVEAGRPIAITTLHEQADELRPQRRAQIDSDPLPIRSDRVATLPSLASC